MAALTLPSPGTEFGPCVEPCEHGDCETTRREAATKCSFCEDPIGYERRFYSHEGALCHAVCLHEWLDAEEEE